MPTKEWFKKPFDSKEQEEAFFRALGKEIAWALNTGAICSLSFKDGTLRMSACDWGFPANFEYKIGETTIKHGTEMCGLRRISAKTYIKNCSHWK